MSFQTISVVGLGYIGLPTAAAFAKSGKTVIGLDVNEHVVETINRGEIHIVEPDLDVAVKSTVEKGLLRASLTAEPADAFLIAVPTPFIGDGHEPDLSYIRSACTAIAPVLKKGDLVVLESTSPVGATEQMMGWLQQERADLTFPCSEGEASDIRVAHCPERVLPGQVMRELVENDRVIGGITQSCSDRAVDLYKSFVQGECVVTNARTAEMAKLTENSFRDVNIAFANELSVICEELNISVWELVALANRHPRVNILQPGPGVGGHCIAVDPWFIVSRTPNLARLIKTAREVNDSKPQWVIDQFKLALAELLLEQPEKTAVDITVACLGLAFKADIDDLRESPALNIANNIACEHVGAVLAVEPNISRLPENLIELGVELCDLQTVSKEADIVLLLVDHISFKSFEPRSGVAKAIIDTKGVWA